MASISAKQSPGPQSSGATARIAAAVAALAMLAFLVAWFGGWLSRSTDPRVVAIQRMAEEARQKFVANGGPQTLAEAKESVATMERIREEIRNLPESLQPQAEAAGGSLFRSAMRQRIDAYLAAPPEKRVAELDRHIQQEELMRQAFAASAGPGNAGGGSGGPGGSGGQRSGGDAAGGGGPRPGGGGRGRTEEGRNAWRKNLIDRTSPQMRARYNEYRSAIEKRKEQLGVTSGGYGPR